MSDEPILAGSGNTVSVSAGEPVNIPSEVLANPYSMSTQREIQQQFNVTRVDSLGIGPTSLDNASIGASVPVKD